VWGFPRALQPVQDHSQRRYDLEVQLSQDNLHCKTTYHRLVGLTLLQCWHDDSGALLTEGYVVPVADWSNYDVHHLRSTFHVALADLAVVSKALHRKLNAGLVLEEPRVGWGNTVLVPCSAGDLERVVAAVP